MGDTMASYQGRHAELYDLFYADKDYLAEARFVHECLERWAKGCSRRVLDLACGTGRHAVALAQLQHEVVGLDYSESMLRVARTNAAAAGMQVQFHLGDLRALEVPGGPYDAAICLFDSIGYVATNSALDRTFQGIHRLLRAGGLLILEFWHAAAMLRRYDPVRIRRWQTPEGEILRISETELDCQQQLAHVTYTVHEQRREGGCAVLRETQTNRYFLVQEMDRWLTTTGFAPLTWLDGYSFEKPVTLDTWHIVTVARRDEGSE